MSAATRWSLQYAERRLLLLLGDVVVLAISVALAMLLWTRWDPQREFEPRWMLLVPLWLVSMAVGEGDNELAVGLISDHSGGTRLTLDRFLGQQGLEPVAYQAARVPRYQRWIPIHRRWGERDVYLVGDAAAQVKRSPAVGGAPGFRSAAAAAQMICANSAFGERGATAVGARSSAVIRRALHGFDEAAYVDLLGSLSGRTRAAMAATSRGSALPMLLRSLGASPRLGLIGARGLIRAARHVLQGHPVAAAVRAWSA